MILIAGMFTQPLSQASCPQAASKLCSMPAEIRNTIYTFVFNMYERRFMVTASQETGSLTSSFFQHRRSQLVTREFTSSGAGLIDYQVIMDPTALARTCQLLYHHAIRCFWRITLLDLGESITFPVLPYILDFYLQHVHYLHLGGSTCFVADINSYNILTTVARVPNLRLLLLTIPGMYPDDDPKNKMGTVYQPVVDTLKAERPAIVVEQRWLDWCIPVEELAPTYTF
ncbi:hypothetical protein SLS60_008730 [Paraconiothyrium brasiliense]|uniref:Uncharacterized protein n=1 Tax=Paraconiothyrium brasiliense TaxID=300254 RepID=A0ABR3QYQ9_9PLEO